MIYNLYNPYNINTAGSRAAFIMTSPAYDFWYPYWQHCRDCIMGTPAIKSQAKREYYLRPLDSHKNNPEEYEKYVKDSPFYNATKRTAKAYSGLIMRKKPTIELPQVMLDNGGQDITSSMLKWALNEVIAVNRAGLFIDYQINSENMTIAQAQMAGAMPDISYWPAETIIRAEEIKVNSALSLTSRVILSYMTIEKDPADEFRDIYISNVKVLDLDENGYYRQRHWYTRNESDAAGWAGGEPIYPLMNGQRMRFIPFQFVDSEENTPEIKEPPLLDIVELNLADYVLSASMAHGEFLIGIPTPVIAADDYPTKYDDNGQVNSEPKIELGPKGLLPLPSGSSWGFLAFNGDGLASVRQSREDKKQEMAQLGARILQPDKRVAEAAETARIHRTGEYSVLAELALSVSAAVEQVERWRAQWMGIPEDEIFVQLNTDFMPGILSGQDLTAIVGAWQSGAMSYETLFENLQRGEIIRSEKTVLEEQEAIEAEQGANVSVFPVSGPPRGQP